jgi:hypothetical protein
MLAALLYSVGAVVLVLSCLVLPMNALVKRCNRLSDWAEVEYWLAVIERKTRRQIKARGVR